MADQNRGRGGRGRGRGDRGGASDRGFGGSRGRGQGDFGDRGRGGGGFRGGRGDGGDFRGGRGGGRGDGDFRGGRGGGDFRGGRGGGDFRGGRGGGDFRGGRGGGDFRGGRGGGFRGGRGGFERGGGSGSHGRGGIYAAGTARLDDTVQKLESEYEKERKGLDIASLRIKPDFPLRPGFGTRGTPIVLWANYFELKANPDATFYRYKVEISGEEQGRTLSAKRLRRIMQLLIEDHFASKKHEIASDFKATLVSIESLDLPSDTFPIHFREADEEEPLPNARVYTSRVVEIPPLSMVHLLQFLSSPSGESPGFSKEEYLQALNIVVGHHPKMAQDTFSIGANKHYNINAETFNLQRGLEALRGFFVSVRAASNRLLVNVHVNHAACYMPGELTNLLMAANMARRPFELQRFLKRISVMVTHLSKQKRSGEKVYRTKTVHGLAAPRDGRQLEHPPRVPHLGAGPKDVMFYIDAPPSGSSNPSGGKKGKNKGKGKQVGPPSPGKEGYVSVFDHFKNTYNLQMNPEFPVVNVGSDAKPSYLPAEVCVVQPGQTAKAKLSPIQTANMIKFAVRPPNANAVSIVNDGAKIIGATADNPSPFLAKMQLSINPNLIAVWGRVLPYPEVHYTQQVFQPNDANWNLKSCKFKTGSAFPAWGYLQLYDSYRGPADPRSAVSDLMETVRRYGIQVSQDPHAFEHPINFKSDNYEAQIDTVFREVVKKHPTLRLILVILPNEEPRIYKRLKLRGDVTYGIHTICVQASKFLPAKMQYHANVAMKFNLKLGGSNHTLRPENLGMITEGKTMVVGIDVTHPSPGSNSNAPSVAGMVASTSKTLTQWPAIIQLQKEAKIEMVDDLEHMLMTRLQYWHKINKTYPDNILVYRDGVSEGQYGLVLSEELPRLRSACTKLYPAKKQPNFTVIVVGKRHNTRFFPSTEQTGVNGSKNGNCPCGTVVDRGVTETRNWDFFLQAHASALGTARPAHYFVVLDEIFTRRKSPRFQSAVDELEDLTHNMCYLFGRATKAVSVCPPSYYADLVCERARGYLTQFYDATPTGSVVSGQTNLPAASADDIKIHDRLKDTMFYV